MASLVSPEIGRSAEYIAFSLPEGFPFCTPQAPNYNLLSEILRLRQAIAAASEEAYQAGTSRRQERTGIHSFR